MNLKLKAILSLILVTFLGGCSFIPQEKKSESHKIKVMVSLLPQKQFVEKIGQDLVDVSVLVQPGFAPETFEIKPEQIKKIYETKLYFKNGLFGFEKNQLNKLTEVNKEMLVVDTSQNLTLRHLEAHTHAEDLTEHDSLYEHDEEDLDPHIWLSPKMVMVQADTIARALIEQDGKNQLVYETNLNHFKAELTQLDNDLRIALAPIKGKTMLVYHPAYGYLADEYGFVQEHFQIEGKEPTIQQINEVAKLAKSKNIKVIFFQKQFSSTSATALAQEINGTVLQIDDLAEDYVGNIRNIADTLAAKLN